jgi:SRSO17 transposase
LSIANHSASLPIAYRLYLPETWANDAVRRKKTHVPKDIRFKTKPQIALDQIRAAHAAGVAPGIVLADAGYGANSDFRAGVSALNLPYVAGIQSTPSVLSPGQAPLPPKPWSGRGRRPCNVRRDDEHKPVSVKDLALSLGKKAWRSVIWREGSNAPLASRFAAVRVHLAARDYKRTAPHPVEWLLVCDQDGCFARQGRPAISMTAPSQAIWPSDWGQSESGPPRSTRRRSAGMSRTGSLAPE